MITREEILKLAALSRLSLSEEEIPKMQHDMSAILAYVDKLKTATGKDMGPLTSTNTNILRDDVNPHEAGIFTEKLIAAAPKHEKTKDGLYIKVKKILGGSQ